MLLPLLAAAGCPTDNERDTDLPLLTGLTFEGAARDNPRVLLFHVDFRDSGADLNQGTLSPLLNGVPVLSEPLLLTDLMDRSGVPSNATAGTLLFELEVVITDQSRAEAGSTFDVGVVATDGAGHESNRPTVTLEISY